MTTPVSPQEIEAIQLRANDCNYRIKRDSATYIDDVSGRKAHNDRDTLLRAIAERDATIARIQSAAKMGMDAAGAIAYANLQRAERLHAESKPEAVDSERAANAVLTEECERLREALAWMGMHGVYINGDKYGAIFSTMSNDGALIITPPAHLRAVLEAARSKK